MCLVGNGGTAGWCGCPCYISPLLPPRCSRPHRAQIAGFLRSLRLLLLLQRDPSSSLCALSLACRRALWLLGCCMHSERQVSIWQARNKVTRSFLRSRHSCYWSRDVRMDCRRLHAGSGAGMQTLAVGSTVCTSEYAMVGEVPPLCLWLKNQMERSVPPHLIDYWGASC